MFVPVVDKNQKPLMPTTPSRARRWIESGKATPFWTNGIFCVRLNIKPSGRKKQRIGIGIDTGIKREAFTVKSKAHTYLNILADAVTWVKDAVESRRNMRGARRRRKTPCRKDKQNRAMGGIAHSVKARWLLKSRIINRLRRIFYITDYIVEDIKAKTKGKRKWDTCFSPLEYGKSWFYDELRKLGNLELKSGYETSVLRDKLGLKKTKSKLLESFDSHNVDSWVLANYLVGGHEKPDNKEIKRMIPLQFHRRQLHRFQPDKNGIRNRYGGTMSLGFKKGSLIKHKKYGLCYIGGNLKKRLVLHRLEDGIRLCQNAKVDDIKFLAYNSFR